jgi:hypothetical protein
MTLLWATSREIVGCTWEYSGGGGLFTPPLGEPCALCRLVHTFMTVG